MPARPFRTSTRARVAGVALALVCGSATWLAGASPVAAASAAKPCKAGQVPLRYAAPHKKRATVICASKVRVGATPAAAAVAVERLVASGELLPKRWRRRVLALPTRGERAFARAREAQVRGGAAAAARPRVTSASSGPGTTQSGAPIPPGPGQTGGGQSSSTSTTMTFEDREGSTVRATHTSTSKHTVLGPQCPDAGGTVVAKLTFVDTDIHSMERRGKRTVVETEYRDVATITGGYTDDMAVRGPLHLDVELTVVTRTRVEIAATHKVLSSSTGESRSADMSTDIAPTSVMDPTASVQDPLKVVMDMNVAGGGKVRLEDFASGGVGFFFLMVGTTWNVEIQAILGWAETLHHMLNYECVTAGARPAALTLRKGQSGDFTVVARGRDDGRPLPTSSSSQVRSGTASLSPLAEKDIRAPESGSVFHVASSGGKSQVEVTADTRRGRAAPVLVPIDEGCGAAAPRAAIPRQAVTRQAAVCTGRFAGTYSATADLSTMPGGIPVQVTLSGNVVLKPNPSPLPPFPGITPPTYYGVESGSFHYHASGTLVGGCQLLADGAVDLLFDVTNQTANVLTLTAGSPATYTLGLTEPVTATVPGTIAQCPNPDDDHAVNWGVYVGGPALIWAPTDRPLPDDGAVSGTNAGRESDAQPLQTWVWDLHPQ
ncbi:MAG: hypothetical protein QOC54_394 [Baekduia sp.]|nr:hypothetical protein [Baekduia sp.]